VRSIGGAGGKMRIDYRKIREGRIDRMEKKIKFTGGNAHLIKNEEYLLLLKALLAVGDVVKDYAPNEDEIWLDAEGLMAKFVQHVRSIYYLSKSVKITEISANFYDAASINALSRVAIETYLVFHYIYIDPRDDEERECRHLCWKLASMLLLEELFVQSHPNIKIPCKIKDEKNELLLKMMANKYVEKLKTGQIKSLLRMKRAVPPYRKLGQVAGLSFIHRDLYYRYTNEHVHSGRHSAVQVHSADNAEGQKQLFQAAITHIRMCMACMVVDYANLFSHPDNFLDKDEKMKLVVKLNYDLAHSQMDDLET
jgi:uncharacterized protein DUF5677